MDNRVRSLEDALALGPPPEGNLAIPIFSDPNIDVELYAPKGTNPQKPHTRDEIYIVAGGSARFFDGASHHDVRVGSFVHVPAGQIHRFEDLSEDFAVWVLFYGPEQGQS